MIDEIKKVEYNPGFDFADEVFDAESGPSQYDVCLTTPKDGHPVTFLSLQGYFSRADTKQKSLGIVMERHELLELGRYIVRVLDPSPEDHILASLKRIEKKLGQD